jgi:hypothetical protein
MGDKSEDYKRAWHDVPFQHADEVLDMDVIAAVHESVSVRFLDAGNTRRSAC